MRHWSLFISLMVTLLIFSTKVIAFSPDPFLGEGKEKYIERCILEGEFPEDKKKFCNCFANKLEKGYDIALKSLKPSDTIEEAQNKMNQIAQVFAEECLKEQ